MFLYQDKNQKGTNPEGSPAGRKEALTYAAAGGVKQGHPLQGHKIWQYLFTSLAHKPFDQANLLLRFNMQTELHVSEAFLTSFITALSLIAKHKNNSSFHQPGGQVNKVYADSEILCNLKNNEDPREKWAKFISSPQKETHKIYRKMPNFTCRKKNAN